MHPKLFSILVLNVSVVFSCAATAQDWPALRGSDGTAALQAGGVLSRSGDVDLKVRWKKTIGSGYSSVVVADGRVLVMFSDEAEDFIRCLDARDGASLWDVAIGDRFKGENGSFDGPISTPVVHENFVACLSADGQLFCLNLLDGKQIWKRDLVKRDKAPKPLYGFATSPMMYQDTLIVQTGAKDASIAAFDIRTGEKLWAVGNGTVSSQSPTLTTLDGRAVALVVIDKRLVGIDPTDGMMLFDYVHSGENGSAMVPVVTSPGKILLTLDDSFSTTVAMTPSGDGISVSQLWKQRSIKNTYNIPVVYDGHVYAYSTRILTSVDATTGRANWKNRKPGDGFLVVVDGHMIINTKKGGLHIARASQEKYDEIASAKVFKDLVWSLPAYSDNSVFMRSLGEVARVDIVSRSGRIAKGDLAKTKSSRKIAELQKLVAQKETASSRKDLVNRFIESCSSFPMVENGLATFIYRGPGSDVAVASDIFGARQERKMVRIEGTNCFYYSVALVNDLRANYIYLIDYKPQVDPRNERTVTSTMYAGEMEFAVRLRNDPPLEMSWFGMPDWQEPQFLKPRNKLLGQVVQISFEVAKPKRVENTAGNGDEADGTKAHAKRTKTDLDIYLPPGYEATSSTRYPVVYVFDDGKARTIGKMVEAIDSLFSISENQGGVRPAIVVFLPGGLSGRVISSQIIPLIDRDFLTIANRSGRSCLGNGFVAGSAIRFMTNHVDLLSGVATQSPMVFADARQMVISGLNKVDQPALFHIQWGAFDMHNPDENWDLRTMAQSVHDSAKRNENLSVVGGQVNDSADWASWRNRYDQVFRSLTKGAK